jgi:hypothetical protein
MSVNYLETSSIFQYLSFTRTILPYNFLHALGSPMAARDEENASSGLTPKEHFDTQARPIGNPQTVPNLLDKVIVTFSDNDVENPYNWSTVCHLMLLGPSSRPSAGTITNSLD